MGNIITKKKVKTSSIRTAVNKAFINFGNTCDLEQMKLLGLNPSTQNIAPSIFENEDMTFTYECIDEQFNDAKFYTFLEAEIIKLAKRQSVNLLGIVDAPAVLAKVTIDEAALKAAVKEMYYNLNSECSISSGALIDFNADGSYNRTDGATANETLASFGGCQLTVARQDQINQTFQDIIDSSSTVAASWLVWIFLIAIVLIILVFIGGIIFTVVKINKKKNLSNYEDVVLAENTQRAKLPRFKDDIDDMDDMDMDDMYE